MITSLTIEQSQHLKLQHLKLTMWILPTIIIVEAILVSANSGATPIGNDNLADDQAITTPQVDDADDNQVEAILVSDEELDIDAYGEKVEIVEGAKKKRKCNFGSSSSLKLAANSGATPIGNDNLADDRAINDQVEEYLAILVSDEELDIDAFEDAITSACICGALNKAHSRTCPRNSRVRYARKRQHSKPLYEVEDYVYLHSKQLKNKHIPCRVFECLEKPISKSTDCVAKVAFFLSSIKKQT